MADQITTRRDTGSIPTSVWVCLGVSALAGPFGMVPVAFVILLRMRAPTTPDGQRWRTMGLMTLGGAVATGAAGAVVGAIAGLGYPPTLWFAVLEGAALGGAPGLLVGALAGTVRVVTGTRRS